jgi:hypothetical protein
MEASMVFPFLSFPGRNLGRLKTKLEGAAKIDRDLMEEVIRVACPDLGEQPNSVGCKSIRAFVQDGAWTDAALALIAHALPQWELRRLGHEDGQWWCALDRRLPAYWADPEVDEHHEDMELAILKAFVAALCRELEEPSAVPAVVAESVDVPHQLI